MAGQINFDTLGYDVDGAFTGKPGSYYDTRTYQPVQMPGGDDLNTQYDAAQAAAWGVPLSQYLANKPYYQQQATQMGNQSGATWLDNFVAQVMPLAVGAVVGGGLYSGLGAGGEAAAAGGGDFFGPGADSLATQGAGAASAGGAVPSSGLALGDDSLGAPTNLTGSGAPPANAVPGTGTGMPNIPSMPPGLGQILQGLGGGAGAPGTGGAPGGAPGANIGGIPIAQLLGLLTGANSLISGSKVPATPGALTPDQMNSWYNSVNQQSQDPQQALYDRTAQQVQQQQRGADSARGIAMSPVSAGLEGDAMKNFNIDWTNSQLARNTSGLSAVSQSMYPLNQAFQQNRAFNTSQQQGGYQDILNSLFGSSSTNPGLVTGGAQAGGWLSNLFGGGTGGGAATGTPNWGTAGGGYADVGTMYGSNNPGAYAYGTPANPQPWGTDTNAAWGFSGPPG